MKKRLIGITGRAGSGKSTVAEFLIEQGFQQIAFADPLKVGLAAILQEAVEDLFSPERKEKPVRPYWPEHVTSRLLMQAVGTEGVRNNVDPNFWVWLAHEKFVKAETHVVVSDVRYEEEAEWVRAQGGKIWRLVRNNLPQITGLKKHVSEQGISSHPDDVTLYNNGSLDELGYSVRQLLRRMDEDGR